MKAIVNEKYGSPDVLQFKEVDKNTDHPMFFSLKR